MRYLYHLAATLLLTCSEAQAQNIWRVDLGAYERQDPCGMSSTELLPMSGRLLLWPSPAAPGSAVRVSIPEGFGLGDARRRGASSVWGRLVVGH